MKSWNYYQKKNAWSVWNKISFEKDFLLQRFTWTTCLCSTSTETTGPVAWFGLCVTAENVSGWVGNKRRGWRCSSKSTSAAAELTREENTAALCVLWPQSEAKECCGVQPHSAKEPKQVLHSPHPLTGTLRNMFECNPMQGTTHVVWKQFIFWDTDINNSILQNLTCTQLGPYEQPWSTAVSSKKALITTFFRVKLTSCSRRGFLRSTSTHHLQSVHGEERFTKGTTPSGKSSLGRTTSGQRTLPSAHCTLDCSSKRRSCRHLKMYGAS